MSHSENLIVGRLPFLVCAPFFHTTLNGAENIKFIDGVPSFLNSKLHAGRIDCAPSSSFEYGLNFPDYFLIPGFSTSSRMEIKSVLFLSNLPWEEISGKAVQLSSDSATSNVLFQILSEQYFSVKPIYHTNANALSSSCGQVFIGDKALSESQNVQWQYRYDLAEIWQRWQALPFSFGLWMIRRDVVASKRKIIKNFIKILTNALSEFHANPSLALDRWTQVYPSSLPRELMLQFYTTADYSFSADHEKSLNLFYLLAVESGHLRELPKLEYLDLEN